MILTKLQVMDQQKFASAAMVLCKALVDREKELDIKYSSVLGHELPELPLYLAREVCTRADFIQQYDVSFSPINALKKKVRVNCNSVSHLVLY